ncbi:MAG: 4Fe-4S dicluster domain-containing protein [Candidatus Lokiarchaeota archaeon]|nr:4Fe-4S dicluster domain-containing protein [Candidatus Lokiarchaeota archaeon]
MQISLETEKCIGCRLCEVICSLSHENAIIPSRSRIEVVTINSSVDIPVYCYQCTDGSCAEVCPVDAINRNEKGIMTIDQDTCINCQACAKACPFGCIGINSEGKIFKCDLCGGDPECVKVCPTQALAYRHPELITYKKKSKFAEKFLEITSEVK